MPNFRPSADVDFTGTIAGSPASSVASNANTAFTGTISFRDTVAPNGTGASISANTGTATADGNVVVTVTYAYTNTGTRLADTYLIFVREGGGTVLSSDPCFASNPVSGTITFTLKPSTTYSFGFSASRVTSSGTFATAITTSSNITTVAGNYTGNFAGSPAATVASNATSGATAFTGTVNYRTDSAPTGSLAFGTISPNYTADGNVVVNVPYTYSPGTLKADFILVYYKEGGGATVSPDNPAISTNPVSGSMNFTLKPSTTYRFGTQLVRRTESGLVGNSILASSADTVLTAGNYTGNVNGTGASTVVTNASNGASAFTGTVNYRTDSAPTGSTVFGTISPSYTSDGNVVVNVPYTHSPGTLKTDFILVYYKEGGGTVVSSDPGVSTNPTSGNLNFTLKPSTTYSFGVQNVRRTESGLVGSSITSSSNLALSTGNYTNSIAGSPANTVRLAAYNYRTGNDQNSTIPANPSVSAFGIASTNDNASVNIKLQWTYSVTTNQTAGNIDGFIVWMYDSASSGTYTITGSGTDETAFVVKRGARQHIFKNLVPNRYYTFGVQAYRKVALSVDSSGILYSSIIQNSTTLTQASSIVNFTGLVGGSPAATVASNASSGLTAFNDTVTFRDPVIPNGTLSNFSPNTGSATADGSVIINVDYTYTDSNRVADYYIIFYKQGGGVITPADPCVVVNPSSGLASNIKIPVISNTTYSFAFSSARTTATGIRATSPQNQTTVTSVNANFTSVLSSVAVKESFDYNSVGDLPWTNVLGAGETTLGSPGIAGGKFLRLGNSAGDDQVWYIFNRSIPYDSNKIYRYRIRARQVSAVSPSDTLFYAGVAGRNATDTQYVNQAGADTIGSQFYIAAEAAPITPANTWVTYTGYFGGTGIYTGAANSWVSPSGLHTNVRYIRPLFLVNYQSKTGVADIDEVVLEVVENNYTGNIGGSAATTVVSNASTAFSGTAKYRTAGAPTNLVTPTGITSTTNDNGTKTIRVSWAAYVQGANQADVIGLFYRKDNNVPTYVDSCVVMNVNVNTSAYYDLQGVNPTDYYSFGIAAGRRTENGIEWGLINTTYGSSGTFSLFSNAITTTEAIEAGLVVVSPAGFYTPNGEVTRTITDNETGAWRSYGQYSTGLTIATKERWMAETWVKQDPSATKYSAFRVTGSNSYTDASFLASNGVLASVGGPSNYSSPEAYSETIVIDGTTWYRITALTNISPGDSYAGGYVWPARGSPANNNYYDPGVTGSVTIGPITVRRISSPNVGFDWTAITADTAANFKGNVQGVPATTLVASNSVGGNLVTYSEALNNWGRDYTVVGTDLNYLDNTTPFWKIYESDATPAANHNIYSNNVSVAIGETVTVSAYVAQGERNYVNLFLNTPPWGSNNWPQAVFNLITGTIDYKGGGISDAGIIRVGTVTLPGLQVVPVYRIYVTSSAATVATNTQAYIKIYNGGYAYTGTAGYGLYATRVQVTKGLLADYVKTTSTTVQNTATLSDSYFGTSKYRTAGAPTNLVSPTGISSQVNSNASRTIRVSWAEYTQGTNQADVIGLFYRRDNNVPTYTDSCIVMNVNLNTPAYYDFVGVNPADQYSFGIAAGRRTESGIEWGLINTTYHSGPYALYGPDVGSLIAGPSNVSTGGTISPLTEYTPNGEQAYRVSDNSSADYVTANINVASGLNITSIERWMAEGYIKKETNPTNINSVFRIIGTATSYGEILFNKGTGVVYATGGISYSPLEYYFEPVTVGGVDWFRMGIAANISPGITTVYGSVLPAVYSPVAASWSPEPTGSLVVGPMTLRRRVTTSTGFDWTGVSATTVNFTGSVSGVPATTVIASNSVGGNLIVQSENIAAWSLSNLYTSIPINYLDNSTPFYKIHESNTNNVYHDIYSSGFSVAIGETITASLYVRASERTTMAFFLESTPWSGGYPQAFFNLATGVLTSSAYCVDAGIIKVGVIGGVNVYRVYLTSIAATAAGNSFIIMRPTNGADQYVGTVGYGLCVTRAQVNRGLLADYVKTTTFAIENTAKLGEGFIGTTKYRTAGAPTNLVTPTGIYSTLNVNGSRTLRVTWAAYTQGTNQADVIGLFYRRDNNVPTYVDTCVIMNVNLNAPGYFDLEGVNPADPYSFGIAAGRRTETGIEWGMINTNYGSNPWYLFGNDLVTNKVPSGGSASVATSAYYTPNGESSYTITDSTGNYDFSNVSASYSPNGSAERVLAEGWIRQDISATGHHGLFRLNSYSANGSHYTDLVVRYYDGTVVTSFDNWASGSPEYFVETHTLPDGQVWYKLGLSHMVSPGATNSYVDIYPAVGSPGATYLAGATGSGVWGGIGIRKISNTNTGFDWTAITAQTANYTANVYGTSAETLAQQPVFESYGPATFNFTNTARGWTAANANLSIQANSIIVSPTAGDPQIRKLGLSFSGATYTKVRARVRRLGGSAAWEGVIYYGISGGHGESGSFYKAATAPSNLDNWNIVEWDMSSLTAGGTDWVTNTINRLRLDLSNDATSNWEVDWITVGRTGVPTYGADYGASPSNLIGLSGDGINVIPQRYSGGFSVIEGDASISDSNKYPLWLTTASKGSGVQYFSVTSQSTAGDIGPTTGYYGAYAIKIKFTGATTGREVYFASSPAAYNIPLVPNSKWIVSGKGWLASPATTPFTVQLGVLTATSPTTGYRAAPTISTRKTWSDLSGILNLTNDSSTLGTLVVGSTASGVGGSPYLWLDGLMLERKVGPGTTPTPWSKGSQYGVLGTAKGAVPIQPSNIAAGTLLNGMGLNQGDGNSRPVLSGLYVGYAKDGDNVTFPTAYSTAPTVLFFPGAQTTGSPFSNVPNNSVICEAQNLTNTGFTARIKFTGLTSSVSPITDSVSFSGSPILSPGSPDSAGYSGNPAASYSINKSNSAEAWDDRYAYTYNITVNNIFTDTWEPGSTQVGLYARKTTGWYLVATPYVFGGTGGSTTTKSVTSYATVDGVIRNTGTGEAEFAIRTLDTNGTINSFTNVKYEVAGTPTQVSATAAGSTSVPFAVIATSGTV